MLYFIQKKLQKIPQKCLQSKNKIVPLQRVKEMRC